MFINFWYVAEESSNVTDGPIHVKMLGQDFVLFRDSEGVPRCLSNVCIHRGGSLAHGKLIGGCVECPYHGWRYDGKGVCRRIPSIGSDAEPPKRARVDSYPTRELYGLIFVFLGDLPEQERPPIMEIPEYGDENWRGNLLRFDMNFNYKRSMENGVDLAHNEFTHSFQLFSQGDKCFPIPDFDIEEHHDGWEAGLRMIMPGAATGLRAEGGKTEPGGTEVYTAFHGISSIRTYIHHTETLALHQYLLETPIDDKHTQLLLYNFRNYVTDPSKDDASIKENTQVVYEDRDVLEHLRPVLTPQTNIKELLVPADKVLVAYRERLRKFEQWGWRIDTEKVNRDLDQVAYAIPSPARRKSSGWVIDSIPLLPGKRESRESAHIAN